MVENPDLKGIWDYGSVPYTFESAFSKQIIFKKIRIEKGSYFKFSQLRAKSIS